MRSASCSIGCWPIACRSTSADLPWPEAIQRVLETEPTPLGAVNPALAGPLEHIVARAMSRERRAIRPPPTSRPISCVPRGPPDRAADVAVHAASAVSAVDHGTHQGVRALAADATGHVVAVGLALGIIELRDAASDADRSFRSRMAPIVALTFSPTAASSSAWDDGTVAMVAFVAAPSTRR